jgi:hypothetical protein
MVASARRLPAPRTCSWFSDWIITSQSPITMHYEQQFDTNGMCDIHLQGEDKGEV